jgi:hypothetical protein
MDSGTDACKVLQEKCYHFDVFMLAPLVILFSACLLSLLCADVLKVTINIPFLSSQFETDLTLCLWAHFLYNYSIKMVSKSFWELCVSRWMLPKEERQVWLPTRSTCLRLVHTLVNCPDLCQSEAHCFPKFDTVRSLCNVFSFQDTIVLLSTVGYHTYQRSKTWHFLG